MKLRNKVKRATNNSVKMRKAPLRESLKAARHAMPAGQRRQYSRIIAQRLMELPEIASANTLFIYLSHGEEVDTHETIHWLLEQRKTVLVPNLVTPTKMEAHRFTHWDQLRPGALGILTPFGSKAFRGSVDTVVTPGLGFSQQGHRLGFGAGYYDRWFSQHSVGTRLAISFEVQLLSDIPTEATDVPMDIILTEKRTIRMADAV